jgi:hypothetical protein
MDRWWCYHIPVVFDIYALPELARIGRAVFGLIVEVKAISGAYSQRGCESLWCATGSLIYIKDHEPRHGARDPDV